MPGKRRRRRSTMAPNDSRLRPRIPLYIPGRPSPRSVRNFDSAPCGTSWLERRSWSGSKRTMAARPKDRSAVCAMVSDGSLKGSVMSRRRCDTTPVTLPARPPCNVTAGLTSDCHNESNRNPPGTLIVFVVSPCDPHVSARKRVLFPLSFGPMNAWRRVRMPLARRMQPTFSTVYPVITVTTMPRKRPGVNETDRSEGRASEPAAKRQTPLRS